MIDNIVCVGIVLAIVVGARISFKLWKAGI
jgi:hypothetical protein